jgi:hypothetical protein
VCVCVCVCVRVYGIKTSLVYLTQMFTYFINVAASSGQKIIHKLKACHGGENIDYAQYSLLGHTAASIRLNTTFRGLAPSPSSGKMLYSNELTWLCAREDYIESCRRESFKTYIDYAHLQDRLNL